MTIEKITDILNQLGFTKKGKLVAPNYRVIFEYVSIKIIISRDEGQVSHFNHLDWTFSLKGISTEILFRMLDIYFMEDEIYSPKLLENLNETYESFRTRLIREEKLKELI